MISDRISGRRRRFQRARPALYPVKKHFSQPSPRISRTDQFFGREFQRILVWGGAHRFTQCGQVFLTSLWPRPDQGVGDEEAVDLELVSVMTEPIASLAWSVEKTSIPSFRRECGGCLFVTNFADEDDVGICSGSREGVNEVEIER